MALSLNPPATPQGTGVSLDKSVNLNLAPTSQPQVGLEPTNFTLNTGVANPTSNQALTWATDALATSTKDTARNKGIMRKPNNNGITVIPDLADINITSTVSRLRDSTSYFSVVPNNGSPEDVISQQEVEAAIQYRNSFKSGAPLTEYTNFFRQLQSKYFAGGGGGNSVYYGGTFSNDSVFYWIKKYFSLPELSKFISATSSFYRQAWNTSSYSQIHLKFILEKYKADTTSFFGSFSDSIGLLANSKYQQLDSTQPIFDITQQNYGVPIPFTANMENKVGPTARNLMYDLSKMNTALMRRNLMNLAYYSAAYTNNFRVSSRVPHACNLVNDIAFFVENSQQPRVEARANTLKNATFFNFSGRLFNFIQYISNIGNRCALNLRDVYAPDPSDKDFVVEPGSTDIAVNQLNQESINAQINDINKYAIADATIGRNLYGNTEDANSQFAGTNFVGKNMEFYQGSWQNIYTVRPTGGAGFGQPSGPFTQTSDIIDGVFSENQPIISAEGIDGVRTLSVNTDGDITGAALSPTGQSKTATNIPNTSNILGYTIPLNNGQTAVPKGTPAIVTFRLSDGRTVSELLVGNDVGGYNTDYGNPNAKRLWGEIGYNTFNKLASDYSVNVNYSTNGSKIQGISTNIQSISYQFLDNAGARQTFANYSGPLAIKQATYNQLRDQLLNEGKIGVNVSTGGDYLPPLNPQGSTLDESIFDIEEMVNQEAAQFGVSQTNAPVNNVTQQVAGALPTTTPAPQQQSVVSKIPEPVINDTPTTPEERNAAVQRALDMSARPYSNRQRMLPFSFLLRVEDIDGETRYVAVDYLLKKIVSDNFNIYTRIATLAKNFAPSLERILRDTGARGQTLSDYISKIPPQLLEANLRDIFSSGNLDLLGVNASTPEGQQILGQVRSILNQKGITNNTLNQTYQTFINAASQRLPTDLLSQITSSRGVFDSFAAEINTIGQGDILPTTGALLDVINPLTYTNINIPNIIPSVSLGSIGDFVQLASSIGTSGPPTSVGDIYDFAKQINQLVCNFEWPDFTWPVIEKLIEVKFDPEEINKAIKAELRKVIKGITDALNPSEIYKQIKLRAEALYKQVKKDLFECDVKKRSDKTGQGDIGV
jgi:hypothetical protein